MTPPKPLAVMTPAKVSALAKKIAACGDDRKAIVKLACKAAPKGKPVHAKQKAKLTPRVDGDEGQRRKGLNAFVDKRPGKQRASDKRGPSGRPSSGKPQRPGAPRTGKPRGLGSKPRGR